MDERGPEIAEHLLPCDPATGNIVELFFKLGGEAVFDIALEKAGKERRHQAAAVFGNKPPGVDAHIIAVLQHRNDRRIGRRSTDPKFFEFFHQRRFTVTGRRLREVLLGQGFFAAQVIAFFHRRQNAGFFVVAARAVIAAFTVDLHEAVERDHRSGGAERQGAVAGWDIDADLVEHGGFHLAGHGPAPDQRVQLKLIVIQILLYGFRCTAHVRRANRFVCFLSVFSFGLIDPWLFRQILRAEVFLD